MPPELPLVAWWDRIGGDPLLGYALAAALVLAGASLIGGWARGDARALTRPGPWIAAASAALAGLALTVAGDRIEAVAPGGWPLHGIRRLPLYLVALGFGPSTGVLAALLFAAIEGTQGAMPAAGAVLALEMAVVGWSAIAPSPRRSRLAAPFAVLLGWTMAMATAGLAVLAWLHRPLPPMVVADAWRHDLPGVLASALLLLLLSPAWWRRATPGAAPGVAQLPATESTARGGFDRGEEPGHAIVPRMRRASPRRRPAPLTRPRLPAALLRPLRGRRRLAPPAVPAAPMEDPGDEVEEVSTAPPGSGRVAAPTDPSSDS